MKRVLVPRLESPEPFAEIERFALCPIASFPWDESGFRPQSEARIAYRPGEALYVQLASREGALQNLRRTVAQANGPVHQDSCLEFFVDFKPGRAPGYLNFELGALGTLHLKLGQGRAERRLIEAEQFSQFAIVKDEGRAPNGAEEAGWWRVRFTLPQRFIRDYYGEDFCLEPGLNFRGNFYKCGDLTEHPHYGLWSETELAAPDFHQPSFFGHLLLG